MRTPSLVLTSLVAGGMCLGIAFPMMVRAEAPAPAPAPAQPPGAQPAAPVAPLAPDPSAPLYRHTGQQYRVYNFPGTGESIPYRLFVPTTWTTNSRLPMLVTLRAGTSVDNPRTRRRPTMDC